MNTINQLNHLFNEWRKKPVFKPNGERGQFIPDGIVCLEEYEKAPIKVMFLLKDTNDKYPELYYSRGVCDEVLQTEKCGTAWNRIAEWARALTIGDTTFIDADDLKQEHTNDSGEIDGLRKYFKKIAIMNLKKSSGTGTISKKELSSFVFKNNEQVQIIDEIKICQPDLIITCSKDTYEILRDDICTAKDEESPRIDFHKKMQEYGHYFDISSFLDLEKPTWVVEYRHPSLSNTQGSKQEHYENMLKIREKLFG